MDSDTQNPAALAACGAPDGVQLGGSNGSEHTAPAPVPQARRERLPNRRAHIVFSFEFEGHRYRATASRYADGRLAEIFLDSGKLGSAVQTSAETAAILASLCLQHGVAAETLIHSTKGPVSIALELAVQP